jgi:hypothetical protein
MANRKIKNFVIPGTKYGRLTVVKESNSIVSISEKGLKKNTRRVECTCECGKNVIVQFNTLLKSVNKKSIPSCGCSRVKITNMEGFELDEKLSSLPHKEKKELIIRMINEGNTNRQIESRLGLYRGKVTEIRQQIGNIKFKKIKEYPIGEKFSRLTLVNTEKLIHTKHKRTLMVCNCDCGNENILVTWSSLKNGYTKSCGCYMKEVSKYYMVKNVIPKNKTHGDSKKISKHYYLYYTWMGAKQRCYNPNNKRYSTYGKMGITMFNDWVDNYDLFKTYIIENLGERPVGKTNNRVDGFSIDRIDVTKGYEPNNLRWATFVEQANNKH